MTADMTVDRRAPWREKVRVVNSEGRQVVDTWVFNALDSTEYLSIIGADWTT